MVSGQQEALPLPGMDQICPAIWQRWYPSCLPKTHPPVERGAVSEETSQAVGQVTASSSQDAVAN